ncbi:bifunctional folylpolyglutamate synthase/dihydrofolate synthase [Roseiterribacter gracilis]|uniref:tetrahydrofolate synthase n=1 Tax=Roseiterribacter gracilis TaxID=2812848 RepID=A0A8S8X817_9PROT|nr:bifunctional folylpolyglutamate synthase/dihydrofolate synthase [Rhodospirillales bacterium TMPK1]
MTAVDQTGGAQAALDRLALAHPAEIELGLGRVQDLLARLGDPQNQLPPVLHVAGTNGKGSTIAFLRALLEASGKRVHAYTSPHLVRFNERIRLAGEEIDDATLMALIDEVGAHASGGRATFFEVTTAIAFLAFTRTPADVVLLETGLGGRLDATNVIDAPAACGITRISIDHRHLLGDEPGQIAAEKAGILKPGRPAAIAEQPSRSALDAITRIADERNVPLSIYGRDWRVEEAGDGFRYVSATRDLTMPAPSLAGRHQWMNAGTALTMLDLAGFPFDAAKGVTTAQWPARLQRLSRGPLVESLPASWELYLDGGHNDSGGEVLAAHAATWKDKPLLLITAMMSTKDPAEFLRPLARHLAGAVAIPIPEEPQTYAPEVLEEAASRLGVVPTASADDARAALEKLKQQHGDAPARVLIAGSLYLAGFLLRDNG